MVRASSETTTCTNNNDNVMPHFKDTKQNLTPVLQPQKEMETPAKMQRALKKLKRCFTNSNNVKFTLECQNDNVIAQEFAAVLPKMLKDFETNTCASTPFKITTTRKQPGILNERNVLRHIHYIFRHGQLTGECLIIAYIYVKRLLENKTPLFLSSEWKQMLTTAFILASKVWDDFSMFNTDFATITGYSLVDINRWEVEFLNLVAFDVSVKPSMYAEIYFQFRVQNESVVTTQPRRRRASLGKAVLSNVNEPPPLQPLPTASSDDASKRTRSLNF